MCCVQLFIEGGRGGDQNPSISSPCNKPFLLCHHFPIQYITYSLTAAIVSLTPFTPFPNSNVTLPSLHTLPPATLQPLQFCSPHPSVPINPFQIAHITNKFSLTLPHASYAYEIGWDHRYLLLCIWGYWKSSSIPTLRFSSWNQFSNRC